MELIKKYNGAVFFVDMLGMSALTNNQINLIDEDYKNWLDEYELEYHPQYLAAALLSEFRKILVDLDNHFINVTVSQLSDCAFAWSENISDIVLFASKFMNTSIFSGLLCRGGMAYGEIIETNREHNLGRFIVGNAVTAAANLEKIAKGARVLINVELSHELWLQNQKFSELINPLFSPFTNPLDFTIYDEFKWYLCSDLTGDIQSLNVLSNDNKIREDKLMFTKQRLKIANYVRCSPKFNWNGRSKEGLIQLKATINFIAENSLLGIFHDFDWSDVAGKRSDETIQKINSLIDEDEYYKIKIEPENEDEEDV